MKMTYGSLVVGICLRYAIPAVADGDVLSALESSTFNLHLTDGRIQVTDGTEMRPIDYNADWCATPDDNVDVVIAENGNELYRGKGYGQVDWHPCTSGVYRLSCSFEREGVSIGLPLERTIEVLSRITYANLKGTTHGNPTTYGTGSVFTFSAPTSNARGYTFSEWSPSGITADMIGDKTVTANWTANTYSIVFHPNEGTGTMENQTATYDVGFAVAGNGFTRKGYVFAGWATNSTGEAVYEPSTTISNLTSVANGTVDFYATWEKLIVTTPTISPIAGSTFNTESCKVTISCATEGSTIYYSTDGTSPRALDAYKYTGAFTITTTTTIKSFAVKDDVKSGLMTAVITKGEPTPVTFETALCATNLGPITTGGDAYWRAIPDETVPFGEISVQSGMIGKNGSTYLETKVKGIGTLTFWWKTSCEPDEWGEYTYDHITLVVDGIPTAHRLDGESDWEPVSYTFTNGDEHTVRWVYSTDAYAASGYSDCAWVNGVTWSGEDWPTAVDPIPDIGETPSAADVAAAVADATDPKVAANIDETNYNDFRAWAGKVKTQGGSTAGAQGVMSADTAWLSYALGQGTLLEAVPTDEDLSVETFEPAAESGKFDFTVSVKDVEVGSEAAKENLKKVFGLEGAATLDGSAFSSNKVDIEFGTPVDGKVKFTAGPKDASAGTFFMKVKILP